MSVSQHKFPRPLNIIEGPQMSVSQHKFPYPLNIIEGPSNVSKST